MDTQWTLVNPLTSDKPDCDSECTLVGHLEDTRWTLVNGVFVAIVQKLTRLSESLTG